MIENPYFHRGAIRQPEYFYGRARETKRALQLLRNGQSVSIVGPRKIGKTSLLLHLMDPQVLAEYGMQADRYLFAYIDGETCGSLGKSEIYRVMLEEASNCLPDGGASLDLDPVLPANLQFRQFGRAIRKLTEGGRKLVYLIDEFEGLGRNRQLEEDFFSSLRSLTLHDVAYVTASQDPLLDLTLQADVLSSPFFNIFALLRLGTFSRQEAVRFVEWSFRQAGVSSTRQTVTSILEYVGTHPFCLQVACYHAFELTADGEALDRESYERLHEDILRDLQDHFAYSLDRLDEDQKRALARLAQMGESEIPLDVAQGLWQRCLVVRGDHGLAGIRAGNDHSQVEGDLFCGRDLRLRRSHTDRLLKLELPVWGIQRDFRHTPSGTAARIGLRFQGTQLLPYFTSYRHNGGGLLPYRQVSRRQDISRHRPQRGSRPEPGHQHQKVQGDQFYPVVLFYGGGRGLSRSLLHRPLSQ